MKELVAAIDITLTWVSLKIITVAIKVIALSSWPPRTLRPRTTSSSRGAGSRNFGSNVFRTMFEVCCVEKEMVLKEMNGETLRALVIYGRRVELTSPKMMKEKALGGRTARIFGGRRLRLLL